MCKAIDVANFFLKCPEDSDMSNSITNMKLQKLMYFAQGHALAVLGHPLFREDFEAWTHGPVIPALYRLYRNFGDQKIPPPESVDFSRFTPEEKQLLEEVWETYGIYSAWGLRNLSHSTKPWIDHQYTHGVIPQPEMRQYFLTLNSK